VPNCVKTLEIRQDICVFLPYYPSEISVSKVLRSFENQISA